MTSQSNSQAVEQEELNLKIISNSLEKACIKHKKKSIKISKEYLLYRIIDEVKVSKSEALKYLNILDARGIIVMMNQEIDYTIKEENKSLGAFPTIS